MLEAIETSLDDEYLDREIERVDRVEKGVHRRKGDHGIK